MGLLDAIHLAKSLYQARFKVSALVTVDAFWDFVAAEPVSDKDLHDRHRLVGTATVYLVNTSVMIRIFSRPSLAVSSLVKSMANI